jgi:hypothetical protein
VVEPDDIVDPEDASDHVRVTDALDDDSDVPIWILVEELTEKNVHKGFVVADTGVLVADREAERFDDEIRPVDDGSEKELGRGKRQRRPNQLYDNSAFWRHDNDDDDKY